ncbi:MAG: carbonic anhydrase [Beutenbergiaceae bacterium]
MTGITAPDHPLTPAQAWRALLDGNARFYSGAVEHPSQSIDRRTQVSQSQHPFAVLFGCSDSRVAAEIIFDRGLGDMFVVRTAGHVVDTTVIGSIEYGVEVLGAPLIVVLGHDSCGAVAAARDALVTGLMPSGMIRAVVDRVIPSIVTRGPANGSDGEGFDLEVPGPAELGREHVRGTVHMLSNYSGALATAVQQGRCAIVGAEYSLADGRVNAVETVGQVG